MCRVDSVREQLIADAVDCLEVAEAASEGVLAVLETLLRRCEALGVPDVLLAELVPVWRTIMG